MQCFSNTYGVGPAWALLEDLPTDDILLMGKTFDEHLYNLRVFQRFQECQPPERLLVPERDGHTEPSEGIRIHERKIDKQ